ncbi:hypothetical protein B0H34DRAFT_809019 [Crassisporium funariophilum]|nr:hypothetical protein B0H34DRAFT_809019 [Crassisporium funariophilum]
MRKRDVSTMSSFPYFVRDLLRNVLQKFPTVCLTAMISASAWRSGTVACNGFKQVLQSKLGLDVGASVIEYCFKEWSFYEDLHSIWSELPNYNPVGVTTSHPGQDFAGKAAALFTKKGGDAEVSSRIEDNEGTFSGFDEDNDADAEGDADISESRLDNSSDGGTLGVSDLLDIDVNELQDDSEIKKLDKENKCIFKAREDKKCALEKSCADEKAKAAKNSKKCATPNNDSLDELHLLEMRDMAARRAEKSRIREKELDLAAKKQEFDNEKYKAKVRKMELKAKKTKQQFELFWMMISHGNGGGSQVQKGWVPLMI